MLTSENKSIVDEYCTRNSYVFNGCIGKRLYLYCNVHKHSWSTVMGNIVLERRCKFCSRESASLKRYERSVENFKNTGMFKEGVTFTPVKGRRSYWEVSCPICSSDKYTEKGCRDTFISFTGSLNNGVVPCRCNYNNISKDIDEMLVDVIEKVNTSSHPIEFTKVEEDKNNSSTKFRFKCSIHGSFIRSYTNFVSQSNTCPKCSMESFNFGFMKDRSKEEDQLYLISMEDNSGEFYKIGRSFCSNKRIKTYPKTLKARLLKILKATHETIYTLEQDIHYVLRLKGLSYTSSYNFKGDGELFINSGKILKTVDKIIDTFTEEEYLNLTEQERHKWIEEYFEND